MIRIGDSISIQEFERIVFDLEDVELSEGTKERIKASFQFLDNFARDKLIYGVNTGFGPMAQYRIDNSTLTDLQYNIIRSHSTGMGNLFSPLMSRSVILCRLINFVQCRSAVSPELVDLLVTFLNKGISPCIYEHGGVGASGDLVQLAHLALALIGEGELIHDGKTYEGDSLFKKLNISILAITGREGLALLNGTSAMTGIGILNLIHAKQALEVSLLFSCIANEIIESFDDHISDQLNSAKRHPGQIEIARAARSLISDSTLIKSRPEVLYRGIKESYINVKIQEYYSMRCFPQILGPVLDLFLNAEFVLMNEINSANDNPIIDHESENVFHGGNFHGDYVSLEMDKIKLAVSRLTMLSERQLNYFLNNDINKKLPPFINLSQLGLNFGLQGMQFTATSTTAENQTLASPMYIHSIPCNNDNQDIVSMGCNAAILAKRVIENSFDVFAIEAIALAQAIDCLKIQDRLSTAARVFYQEVREICPVILQDIPTYKVQKKISNYLAGKKLNNIKLEA
jgi:histidine ammonia-lyase